MPAEFFFFGYLVLLWLYLGGHLAESFTDKHWARWQLIRTKNFDHYVATEHGGVWGNFFLLTPTVAYLQSKYRLELSGHAGALLMVGAAIWVGLLYVFRAMGMKDHIVHDGEITRSGWLLVPFTAIAVWIFGACMLGWTKSPLTATDALIIAVVLTGYFPLGLVKFNRRRWRWRINDTIQSAVLVGGVWLWYVWNF
jgi:hypothetical protein